MYQPPPRSTLFPYTTLFRSARGSHRIRLFVGPPSPATHAPHTSSMDSASRSEEHTSELQSQFQLVCRLLLEKKKKSGNVLPEINRKQILFLSTSFCIVLVSYNKRYYRIRTLLM